MEGGASDIIVMMYNVYTVNQFFHTHFIYTVDREIFASTLQGRKLNTRNFVNVKYLERHFRELFPRRIIRSSNTSHARCFCCDI